MGTGQEKRGGEKKVFNRAEVFAKNHEPARIEPCKGLTVHYHSISSIEAHRSTVELGMFDQHYRGNLQEIDAPVYRVVYKEG